MTERTGGWRGKRWRVNGGDPSLLAALVARGIELAEGEVDVTLEATPSDAPGDRFSSTIHLPPGLIGAPPELVADHAIALAHARLAERALARWLSEQSEMVDALTHDLKNPIAVLRANLEYLRGCNLAEDGDAMETIDDAQDAVQRVDQLVEDIRLVDALEQCTLPIGRMPVAMSSLEDGVSLLGQKAARRKSATVQVTFPGNVTVLGDPGLLRILLERLVVGRVRHVGRHGRVMVTGKVEGDRVTLLVGDSGAPIAEDLRGIVFDKTGPGRLRSRELGDVGVGLYLSRLIVSALGGRIWLSDDPVWPTCFSVDLPAAS